MGSSLRPCAIRLDDQPRQPTSLHFHWHFDAVRAVQNIAPRFSILLADERRIAEAGVIRTKALVKRWVDFYKRHHGLDVILHVNPQLPEKGLGVVYNPLDQEVQTSITLPLTSQNVFPKSLWRRTEPGTTSQPRARNSNSRVVMRRRRRLFVPRWIGPKRFRNRWRELRHENK